MTKSDNQTTAQQQPQQQGTANPRPQAGAETRGSGQMGGTSTQFTDWASI